MWIQVVLCKFHTAFLCADGQLFTCGVGRGGRLGHGDEQTHVVRISAGGGKIVVSALRGDWSLSVSLRFRVLLGNCRVA